MARAVGLMLASCFGIAIAFGVAATGGVSAGAIAAALPVLLLAVRSLMLGVWIEGTGIRIVSWLRMYRIEHGDIAEILIGEYSGYFNRWADGDLMSRHVSVLGLAIGREDRLFPATAMRKSTARRSLPAIEDALRANAEGMGSRWEGDNGFD
ncbi:hypothetical protein [Agromyces sp. PvR057]|uniref:hypothetical protein n=1 Tax=Agromyces sp. PvR057 TaxID=3156403 RepID=UPI003399C873